MDAIANLERLLGLRGRSWSWLVRECNAILPKGLKLSDTRCSRWKAGKGWPRPAHLAAFAKVLDVPADVILAEDPATPVPPERSPDEQMLLDVIFRGPNAIGIREAMRRITSAAPGWPGEGNPPPAESRHLGSAEVQGGRRVGRPRKPRTARPAGEVKIFRRPPADGPKGKGPEGKGPKGKGPKGKGPKGKDQGKDKGPEGAAPEGKGKPPRGKGPKGKGPKGKG